MVKAETTTRRAAIGRLSKIIQDIIQEQSKINHRLETVKNMLDLLAQDPDVDLNDDYDMDEDMTFEDVDPDELEYDGEIYKKGEVVQLYDSQKKRWTPLRAKIRKFCDKMCMMNMVPDGKKTSRKYGNFRHIV